MHNEVTNVCDDENECRKGDPNICQDGYCVNTDSSYYCICKQGFVPTTDRKGCIGERAKCYNNSFNQIYRALDTRPPQRELVHFRILAITITTSQRFPLTKLNRPSQMFIAFVFLCASRVCILVKLPYIQIISKRRGALDGPIRNPPIKF